MDPEKAEEGLVKRFKSLILPDLVREGRFFTGRNSRIDKCQFKITERFTDHFASSPYFVELTVDSDEGKTDLDLVVKFCVQDDNAFELMRVDRQFYNEVKMYNEIVNEFRKVLKKNPEGPQDLIENLIPKCYSGHFDGENPKESYLVFENLRKAGYKTADSRIFLDFEHCAAAVKQAGLFHALSLSLKMRDPETLDKLKNSFIECRYFEDPSVREMCEVFIHKCNQRGIEYLLSSEDPATPKEYVRHFRELISQPHELMMNLIKPKEPIALICHGDFCRNNMLFRYENGHIADVKIFDFQTPRFASPSIDLAFFLYLNTDQELRDEHFDEIFAIYYSTLTSTTAAILGISEREVADQFPLQLFKDDFAEHAVYGYVLAAFFLAAMSSSSKPKWDETLEEQANYLNSVGGEKVSKRIADILLDFHKRKFYLPS